MAAIFRDSPSGVELLFIERATKDSDPWSGQMAFPGGRMEPGDGSARATAERETREEIDLDLDEADRLGSLIELDGGRATNRFVLVSCYCYHLPGPRPALRGNAEVADVLWLPLEGLLDQDRYVEYWYPPAGAHFPGIQLDQSHQVIWGLTLRFLADLFARLDRAFII